MEKKEISKMPDLEVEGWSVKELADQAANQEVDEILKQVLDGKNENENSELPDIEAYKIEDPVNVKKDEERYD